ncbi:MAG TPA: two-component regulator propeller domain-containing protein [Thermoanaerobaculia bacterium]
MIHRLHGRLAALALGLGAACLPSLGHAQERIDRSFRMADGLSNPQIYAISQDRDGFLWIGTWDGVNRFDGVHFTRFLDQDGVPPGRILALHQAADGPLYLGGDGGGAFFDGERFLPLSPASGLAGAAITAIAGLWDGTVFFGGTMGLVARRPGGKWSTVLPPQSPVKALCAAKDGTLYVGTVDGDVLVLREGRLSPWKSAEDLGGLGAVWSLHEGRNGTLYVGADRGLAVLRNGSREIPLSTRGRRIESITTDEDGILYLATRKSGILRLRESSLEPLAPLAPENGVSDEWVHTAYAVTKGPVYFGTDAGLDRWSGEVLQTWTLAQGLPDKTIWSVVEDEKGDLYAASNGGVAILQGKKWRSLGRKDGFPEGPTLCLHAGASGRLYAGDDQGHVWISERGRLLRIVSLQKRDLVLAILEAPDGVVYAATVEGFAVIRGPDVRFFPLPGNVYSFVLAADGTLYLGTSRGLAAFRDGKVFRQWTRSDGLKDDWIWTVRTGRDGSLLAGTRRGLSVLRNGRIKTYDTSNGLANNFVVCILEGEAGRLYLSTNRGVNVLDLGAPTRPRTLPFSGFGEGTGNPEACLKDRQGRLWFGIQPLLAVYDPALDRPRHPPRALLTGLQVFQDHQPLPLVGETKPFSYGRNDLTFSFAGIDLAAHFMKFRYRLSGLDRDWIETDQRSARYPNLRPGSYRFELQAGSESGLWSSPARLGFTILPPPWWRRPALVLGLAAAALALAGGLYAVARVRQILALDRLRAAIAADLHDQVGAGLTDIAILSEVAARKAGESPELTRVAATARELVEDLGDIVWLVNPRRDTLYELFVRLKDSYAELFAQAGAELEVADLSPLESARLPMAFRQNLHLLFKEALHNALRHSGCRRAELTVTLHGTRLAIVLRDDGAGFDPESRNGKGDGLATMQRRAERLGGQLTIDSSPEGTVVSFAGVVPRT